MAHVPYKGAPQGRTAVMAREVELMFDGLLAALPHIKAGRLRGLAVTSGQRSAVAPDIPTIAEAGVPGYAADAWYALLAPAGTPAAVVARLEGAVVKALAAPAIRARMLAQGVEPVGSSQQAFRAFLKAELVKWGRVVKAAGIKAE
jgi:tripartite-type tricarboxylate transporter receptor subunit TctC